MADYRAIEAVSESIIHLLQLSYVPADFDPNVLQFEVYGTQDFSSPMLAGVSLFLYRIIPDGTHRIPTGRRTPDGRQFQTQLPVDLHYLATVWAPDVSLQHRIAGWVMRTLEDTPVLPYGLMETVAPDVFEPDETVEILLDSLTTEDLMRIWDALRNTDYQLSIPYIARNVRIGSRQRITRGEPIQQRSFDMARYDAP